MFTDGSHHPTLKEKIGIQHFKTKNRLLHETKKKRKKKVVAAVLSTQLDGEQRSAKYISFLLIFLVLKPLTAMREVAVCFCVSPFFFPPSIL